MIKEVKRERRGSELLLQHFLMRFYSVFHEKKENLVGYDGEIKVRLVNPLDISSPGAMPLHATVAVAIN